MQTQTEHLDMEKGQGETEETNRHVDIVLLRHTDKHTVREQETKNEKKKKYKEKERWDRQTGRQTLSTHVSRK